MKNIKLDAVVFYSNTLLCLVMAFTIIIINRSFCLFVCMCMCMCVCEGVCVGVCVCVCVCVCGGGCECGCGCVLCGWVCDMIKYALQ